MEDTINDSYAMRRFLVLDLTIEQVPDATTLIHFHHLLVKYDLRRKLLESQAEMFEEQSWIMRGGTIVDATIIAAPCSTKNADGARDPEMLRALKGNQWYFGMKAHIGVDAETGFVHYVPATAASVHDLDQITHLTLTDDAAADDPHLSRLELRIAARKSKLTAMAGPDRVAESRKASVRAKADHRSSS